MIRETQTTLTDAWSWWLLMINTNDFTFVLTVTATVLLVISLVTIIFTKSNKFSPPLPPGPKSLPLVGNLLSLDPDLHTYFARLGKTYGPILTLWLGHKVGIVINSPGLAREVLKDQDTSFANRDVPAAAYEAFYGGNDIVWTPHGPKWRMLRRVCLTEMLSKSALDSFYDLRRKEIRQTMGYIYRRVGSPVDIGEQMFLTLMNIVTSMMWGGTVKGDDRAGLGAEFRLVVHEITELLATPNISDFYPGLARFDLQGIRKKTKVLTKKFDDIFETAIKQRHEMDAKEGGKAFLQFLLKLKDNQDAKMPFTMTDLKAMLMDMVTGGTDTTSNTVEFALAEMMNKPQIIQKVQEELEIVVGENNIVEESHLPKLPYLYAVMKEILRLHPVVPLLVPHCPSETCVVGGYTVPEGSRVFINVWSIHRDPSIWNKPLEFIPERFLDGQLDQSGKNFDYLPFGSGRRTCVGIAMAENMFLFSLASLLHSFDWKLPQGQKLDLTEKFGIVMKKAVPLVLIPSPRLSNPELYQ
ncbi:hypothetical protein AgCh_033222 [Apium graveolens]